MTEGVIMSKELFNVYTVPHNVVEDVKYKKLCPTCKVLFHTLCKIRNRYKDKEGYFWHSMDNLSDLSGLNIRTIIRAKSILKRKHFIDVKRYNRYKGNGNINNADYYKINDFQPYIPSEDRQQQININIETTSRGDKKYSGSSDISNRLGGDRKYTPIIE